MTATRRSRQALLAAFASTAVACGGTVSGLDASTAGDGGADANVDDDAADAYSGFDSGVKDTSVPQDAFIAQDGFCCPLYGGTPSP
ncbi:hypothetical protein BH09MYX1_BH09MYX1_40800 [soil metagenome]